MPVGSRRDFSWLDIRPAVNAKAGYRTHVLRSLLARAAHQSKVLTLAVMKLNPAVRLYERLGFRITHQDEYKLYMRADPQAGAVPDVVHG
jgi:ribosomal protein S18 acetylase RimI-like enzyme